MMKSKLNRFATKPGHVSNGEVNRVGGEPIGMTKASWPQYEGKPMYHVLTLSRDLVVPSLPEKVAAVAVFVQSLDDNEAFTSSTEETKVVFLSREDLKRGTTTAQATLGAPLPKKLAEEGKIVAERSGYVFDEIKEVEEEMAEADMSLGQISSAVCAFMNEQLDSSIDESPVRGLSARHAHWIQGPEEMPEGDRVLFWFSDEMVPGLNCGDGFMYVTAPESCTEGRAWYQC